MGRPKSLQIGRHASRTGAGDEQIAPKLEVEFLEVAAVASVVGVFAIRLVKRITSQGKFGRFCYYLWGAGVLTIVLSLLF